MPSLADIPDDLLDPDTQDAFVNWLANTPTDFPTRRSLAAIWRRATKSELTANHWHRLKLSSEPTTNGPQS